MSSMKLLVVEDDPLFGGALRSVLAGAGHEVRLAVSGADALSAIGEESFDLVIQDIKLPDVNGLDLLRQILARQPHCGSLVMTGYGTIDDAVTAMKMGAFDFLTKPFAMEVLFLRLDSFAELRKKGKDVQHYELPEAFSDIITRSPAMLAALEMAARVAHTSTSVLLQGESGTGKERVAEAIHRQSPRGSGPFVPVNCAAIPATLIESELFGVEKGAYTGAEKGRPGYIEMAEGGTLFLDEIGELPLELQGKLLRVLQEKGVARVGSTAFREIDFRLVCATNRDLSEMAREKEFREDLLYRINVVLVRLPPLRERREDIPLLLRRFLEQFAPDDLPELTAEALDMLVQYNYPGNVRELRNIAERISLLHGGGKVTPQHLPAELQSPGVIGTTFESFTVGRPLKEAVSQFERRYIEKVVDYAGGRKTLAAKMLGLSRKVLWEKLKKE
ncbi:sigma-54 dependent transcriptional regulator [Geomonas sp. Red32]|uniref:sigma-54-dependent transcriptional regulator n=1 Tax=Geomonas sp. Red32 TaxID=2912856 RepID=UPI00202CDCAE|nr:sigma-54 dependent transcriptional regulator [Geomonas sp. Red32]MCM0082763.1 sigma-54 dependent transcriptional regulator [Geomonas sp. Red32]